MLLQQVDQKPARIRPAYDVFGIQIPKALTVTEQHPPLEGPFLKQHPGKQATLPILRVSASMASANGIPCPESRRTKAHVNQPWHRPWRQRPAMEGFLFDPLFTVLDAHEHDGVRLGQALNVLNRWGTRLDVSERRWVTHATFPAPTQPILDINHTNLVRQVPISQPVGIGQKRTACTTHFAPKGLRWQIRSCSVIYMCKKKFFFCSGDSYEELRL